ncbi:hypothetical protein A8713_13895 [Streptomyces sp. SAT1]|uniref:hypothetical protein n=1 Tax=Streptomyces sp. SAT1 TaxID=1849967 RepID=UPI0007DD549C|nr:hypothetical protein [Streptomyces sp. SAT1]ANH92119.1 hypothetical protein A8713_13895 [Streptomyces sp. SAT1]
MQLLRVRRIAGTAALLAAGVLALAGCDDDSGTPAAHPAPATASAAATSAAPEPSGEPATEPASTRPAASATATPAATLRDYTGSGVGTAVAAARAGGLRYAVHLQGTGRSASSWGAAEKVCEQRAAGGAVTFTVARDGRDCAGRPLHTPAPAKTASGDGSGGTSGGSGGTTGGSGGGNSGSKACALTSPAGNCYADGQFCADRHHGMSTYGKGGEYLTCAQDGAGRWRWSDGVAG